MDSFWQLSPPFTLLGLLLAYMVVRAAIAHRKAAVVRAQQTLYEEWTASGCSERNLITKIGGARGCLRLVVTERHLWVTSWPWTPFVLLAVVYDMEHVIPLPSIRRAEVGRRFGRLALWLDFERADGESRSIAIVPKQPRRFAAALRLPTGILVGTLPD